MSTRILRPRATVTLDSDAMSAASGSFSLDSGRVPYAQADVALPFLSDEQMEWLDPREVVRVEGEAGDASAALRPFDLGLRSRSVDVAAKTLTVTLAGDEALLMDYVALERDGGARAEEASVRDVVNYVLAKIGASLEAGSDDADATAHWEITNLLTNPSLEVDYDNWSTGTGASGADRILMSVPPADEGAYALGWAAAAGDSNVLPAKESDTTTQYPVNPGDWYVWTFRLVSSEPTVARAAIQWWSSDGDVLSYTSFGDTDTSDDVAWTTFTLIAQVPEGATHGMPYVNTIGNGGTELHYVDAAMFYRSAEVVPYFDGDYSPSDGYIYEWASDAHKSTSRRVPDVVREPSLFEWQPGVSAWDFLVPITSALGLVLWCDELRRWWLKYPENRTLPTLIALQPSVTRDGTDSISRDDSEAFVTGVVLHYTWTRYGESHEEWDTAGTPEKVVVIDIDAPYPGPGAAAAVLSRRQGTGRRQDVTAVSRWDTTPGMSLQVSLPGSPDTVGRVTAVDFDLASGFMTLTSSGLVDIIEGSIDAEVGTIDSWTGTIDSP